MNPTYREIFNNIYQFAGVLTPDGTLRAANDTVLAFTGVERDDVVGEHLWEVPGLRYSEFVQRRIRADVRKAADNEYVRHELTIRGAERTATVDFSLRPLTDEDDTVTHLIAEGHDLTPVRRQDAVASHPPPGQPRSDLLITYSRAPDEPMSEAVLQAFLALDVDVFERDRTFQDWLDTDLVDGFDWQAARPLTITTRLWGYPVVLTGDGVRIYADAD